MDSTNQNPVLHIIVVGFHHKKGCQVEYAFPPLTQEGTSESNECPAGWKYLPTLALPDGSHNFDEDTAFFHIPSLQDPNQTVFGISCFRQIPVEKLKNRTSDLTRGTVQKSVCVLSLLPLYGHIQVKMSLITHAYFDEGDFTKVSLLQDTYHHLNSCLMQIENLYESPQLYVGLSVRDFILRFRHKALLLFKLLLLERRIVMFCSPVQPLCSTILSLLSLHPGMIERGLVQSACIRPSRPMSPLPVYPKTDEGNKDTQDKNTDYEGNDSNQTFSVSGCDSVSNMQDDNSEDPLSKIVESKFNRTIQNNRISSAFKNGETENSSLQSSKNVIGKVTEADLEYVSSKIVENCSQTIVESVDCYSSGIVIKDDDGDVLVENNMIYEDELASSSSVLPDVVSNSYAPTTQGKNFDPDDNNFDETVDALDATYHATTSESMGNLTRDFSIDVLRETAIQDSLAAIAQIDNSSCGVPLPIFTEGYLCLPYLSLPYLDVLADTNVHGYVVGATNTLFKQKRQIAEILVEVDEARIESKNPELWRLLHLSTEDLRFADYLVRHVADEKHDVFLDGVGWEGGDEWIRSQFKSYLLCLLRTSLLPAGSREIDHFNAAFVNAWRETRSYKQWLGADHEGIFDLNPGHPFIGQLSVADVKLRFSQRNQPSIFSALFQLCSFYSQNITLKMEGWFLLKQLFVFQINTMQTTEGGRKLNAAVQNTSRVVATTGKAVGGAITQATGAFTTWWNNITTVQQITSPDDKVIVAEDI